MSRGIILEHLGEARYRVKMKPDNSGLDAKIAKLDLRLTQIPGEIEQANTAKNQKQTELNAKQAAVDAQIRKLTEWPFCVATKVTAAGDARVATLLAERERIMSGLGFGACGAEVSLISFEIAEINNFTHVYLSGDPPDISGAMLEASNNQSAILSACLGPPSAVECASLKDLYCDQGKWWGDQVVALSAVSACYEEAKKGLDPLLDQLHKALSALAEATQRWQALKLQKTALERERKFLQDKRRPEDERKLWDAAYVGGLKIGLEVGIIDVVDDERLQLIRPGCGDAAKFTKAADLVEVPLFGVSPAAAFVGIANRRGGQYWKPTYRSAVIVQLDAEKGTATLVLDEQIDPLQKLKIDKIFTIEKVPFRYLDCDHEAFSVADQVLVEFSGRDRAKPVVIGFAKNPKPCGYMETGRMTNLGFVDTVAANYTPALLGFSDEVIAAMGSGACNGYCPGTQIIGGPSQAVTCRTKSVTPPVGG